MISLVPWIVVVAPAWAGDVEEAERRRLVEEMRSLAQRSQWQAVDDAFRRLEALEAKGVELRVEELQLAADAARQLGDITLYRDRLARAARAGGSPEVIQALEDLAVTYGAATLTLDPKFKGEATLTPATPPFAPDQRAAVARADAALRAGTGWSGLLPAGDYTAGATAFTVRAGEGPPVAVTVAPLPTGAAAGEPYRLAYAGPRVSVGAAYTAGGALTEAGRAADAGLQAASFAGAGARVGVGLEVGFTRSVGVLAEVGYHNLFGPARSGGEPLEGTDALPVEASRLHLGFGWLAASVRAGPLQLAAGPIWGAGGATVTGVDGWCAGEGDEACATDTPFLGDAAPFQPVSGRITAGGVAGAVGIGLFDLGGLRGGLAVEGGAQTDRYRWYPWGQLGFALTPRIPGEEG